MRPFPIDGSRMTDEEFCQELQGFGPRESCMVTSVNRTLPKFVDDQVKQLHIYTSSRHTNIITHFE